MNPLCAIGLHDDRRMPRTDFSITHRTFVGSTLHTVTWWECERCGRVRRHEEDPVFHATDSSRFSPFYHPSNVEADYGSAEGITWTVDDAAETWSPAAMEDYLRHRAGLPPRTNR